MSNTPMTDTIVNLFNAMKNEQNQDEKYLAMLRHARRLERERADLIAALAQFEQLIDRPVAESGGYSYTMANAPTELVSAARALLARVQS
jgi:hypothetical protein